MTKLLNINPPKKNIQKIILVKMFFQKFFRTSKRCYSVNNSISKSTEFYDIVIVGGGLVGNAMACSLGTNSRYQKTN